MTPGARVAAAMEILDVITTGRPAEQALTQWARRSRFAGSKDRSAIRDHVFDALRRWRSAAAAGGGQNGRAVMLGLLREDGLDPAEFFTGDGHAPPPLTDEELRVPLSDKSTGVSWNLPDWILPEFTGSLGAEAQKTAQLLQSRASVTLRVNTARSTRAATQKALAAAGIATTPNPLCDTALTVTEGARRVKASDPFKAGWIEFQDAASQAVVALLPGGARCLDYCAGGGGKALAMAADGRTVFAHDVDPARMKDLPGRAERAGATIAQLETAALQSHAPFDVVLCDAPCSGSGSWRRAPHGKWTLSPGQLKNLTRIQDEILAEAAHLVSPEGALVYATCSVLKRENEDRIETFLARHPDWSCRLQRRFDVQQHGDGFFTAHLTRVKL
ncbi:RsmB/NOP family class I SAM-dependent RNA methyltransferase [uncultured Roseobacter sp.]|uniref:RsmB/NOP family class I SAM-dependent RNA methyltransferase n=1 Tax=uncultured Roseobacter sp. TaxID=114847 RepID=UPI00263876CC|nr:RsmB/NOP family class I SAM-dependent RNA methyltransferase [uncultured Roseobacter sp.]